MTRRRALTSMNVSSATADVTRSVPTLPVASRAPAAMASRASTKGADVSIVVMIIIAHNSNGR